MGKPKPDQAQQQSKIRFTVKSLALDLELLEADDLYVVEISTGTGSANWTEVPLDVVRIPEETQQALKDSTYGVRSVRLSRIFPFLHTAWGEIRSMRDGLYRIYTRTLGNNRVVPGQRLAELVDRFEDELEPKVLELLAQLEQQHPAELTRWLGHVHQLMAPSLETGAMDELTYLRHLKACKKAFPNLDRIRKGFKVHLHVQRRESLKDVLSRKKELYQEFEEMSNQRNRALKAEAKADAARIAADAEVRAARAIAQAKQREQEAYERALKRQEEQINTAVEEHVAELRHQVCTLLHRTLTKALDRGWNSATFPPAAKRELQTLINQAKTLSGHERSLKGLVSDLTKLPLSQTASVEADQQSLQLQSLLQQLEGHLSVPDLDAALEQAQASRAAWVDWEEEEVLHAV